MTYEETSALIKNEIFRGRVSVGCTKFATYITDEQPTTPAHPTRYKWAIATLPNPEGAVAQIIPTVVMDPAVQLAGAAITDQNLQTAVEAAVQKLI